MKLLKVIRAVEWWEYKLPPILVGAYLILTRVSSSITEVLPLFLFILSSLVAGAVYVSVLNDVTDVGDDLVAGKENRMAAYGKTRRLVFVGITLMIAALFGWQLRTDALSWALYIACYLSFTLYSLPPFRLKKRGLPGIFADAAGSQLLPTLYAAAVVSAQLEYRINNAELLLMATWSFCFGLRGILWHQFHDLENDVKSGLSTWVQKLDERRIKSLGTVITTIEVSAIMMLVGVFNQYSCLASLALYFLYLWRRYKKDAVEIIMFRYTKPNYCIFMNEYYQVFLPLTILVTLSLSDSRLVYVLLAHILLYPKGFYRVLNNSFSIGRLKNR